MSTGVCLVERSRAGDRLEGAVFATGLDVLRWRAPKPPAGDDGQEYIAPDPAEAPRRLAKWLDGQLGKNESLGQLVVDAEGSLCGWLRAPSADDRVVSAMIRGVGEEHAGPASATLALGPDHELPGAAGLQTLAPPLAPSQATPDRVALLSVPDAAVRVLIDELDRLGHSGVKVVSVWHALAEAWDPAADNRPSAADADDDRFAGSSEPMTAVVAIDPRGRLLWSWSDNGKVVAAGSLRLSIEKAPAAAASHETGLAVRKDEPEPGAEAPAVRGADLARLASDWLGWAGQIGVSPGRVIAVTPRLNTPEGALSGAEFGAGLGKIWPGASVDLAVHDDPVQATLDQLLRRRSDPDTADGRAALSGLSNRPGRSHRALYRWSAAALLAAGGALGVWAFRVSQAASDFASRAAAVRNEWYAEVEEKFPDALYPPGNEVASLEGIEAQASQRVGGTDAFEPAVPVLRELEELSWVIGNNYFEVEEIAINRLRPTLRVVVEDIGIYEDLRNALRDIESQINWSGRSQERPDGSITAVFSGRWKEGALSGPAGSSAGSGGGR